MAKRIVWTEPAKTDIRGIEQQAALQILKTLARYARTGQGNTKQLQGVEPPLSTPCSGSSCSLPRQGEHLEILRVLDRKEAYR